MPELPISTRESRNNLYTYPASTTPRRFPIEPNRKGGTSPQRLPFEIYARGSNLVAAGGMVGFTNVDELVKSSPSNGTWYLQAKVIIDNTTGNITSATVEWVSSEGVNTATTFYYTVGDATVTGGVIDQSTIVNYTYAPILVLITGALDDKWMALLY
jgi:hypothetical protein